MLTLVDVNAQINNKALNILVVDDEEIICHLLTDILSDRGYNVFTRSCAEDALEVIKMGQTDIVISDIRMKGMDGIELLIETKKIAPQTDVIIMTGYSPFSKTAAEIIEMGAIGFLDKPLNLEQLINLIEKSAASHKK